MQNNFECIFKLIVALTFLKRVVCSHYQYSFLMFYIILLFYLFIFFVCLFYFLERKTAKRKKKERAKQRK